MTRRLSRMTAPRLRSRRTSRRWVAIGSGCLPSRQCPPRQAPKRSPRRTLAALTEVEQKLPGLVAHMEPDNPGMHTTDTIDFEVVLSGEVILELDDGAERVLRPGDTVVQNGTRHRWGNPGSEPAVVAVFITGAHRAGR